MLLLVLIVVVLGHTVCCCFRVLFMARLQARFGMGKERTLSLLLLSLNQWGGGNGS
jgi:hypothetical protein